MEGSLRFSGHWSRLRQQQNACQRRFMPTLCFGGTFNPIHNGHLRCAQAVAEKAGYDRVLLIPSAQPPHKQQAKLAPAADRLAMCRLATAGNALFDVSDIETRRTGPSYTVDTATQLLKQGDDGSNWPHNRIPWLIGADMLLYLPKWHRPDELLRLVHFVIMARPGWTIDWSALPPEFHHLKSRMVEAPLIEISASDIRRRICEGLPIDSLVPRVVSTYISKHGLYLGEDRGCR